MKKAILLRDRHKPDFSIWEGGKKPIWIEYFGTDRSNSVAPGISKEGYLDGIKWKKEVHSSGIQQFSLNFTITI
jgi:hypothetical protein